ncbi:glycine zipper 2TM domain-containing protein [Roseateles sp. NT4]|uniref:glycine zipper 2TM domain-containing protein n=1 Tax=Roseateles sp. NT4 TaxID=3453715 RepID=UPI003EE8A4FC
MKLLIATAALAAALSSTMARAEDGPAPVLSIPTQAQRDALCRDCLWVQEIHAETREGKGSGLGVVGGAVIGGLLGHQVGGGAGKKLATIGGAAAGGYAGNEVEKNAKKSTVWIAQVVDRSGQMRRVEMGSDPMLTAGDTVRERDGMLIRI